MSLAVKKHHADNENNSTTDLRQEASVVHPQLLRREKIARELWATEKSYVDSLNLAVRVKNFWHTENFYIIIYFLKFNFYFLRIYFFEKVYLKPVMDSVIKNDPIISAEDLKSIFSIIEIIAKINAEFLQNLDKRMEKFDAVNTQLGDLLLQLVILPTNQHVKCADYV